MPCERWRSVFDRCAAQTYSGELVGQMLTVSPITRQSVGRTFTTAISVLGVGALLQLGAVCWAFAIRLRAQPMAMSGGTEEGAPLLAKLSNPGGGAPDLTADPFADPSAPGSTAPLPPKPTPVPVPGSHAEETAPANRFEELIAQGKTLRERGDTSLALTRFREAGATNPQSPIPIAELATTYEKMGLADKAGENWRRIFDMGEAAGIYFSLAEAKLKVAMKQPGDSAPSTPDSGEVEGIASGMTLGLLPITAEDQADPASAKKFTLKIPIKSRPHAKIDAHELVIHVLFYDILNGQTVVQTSANVSSHWLTTPADWVETDTEELAVDYQLPKPEPRTRESRKYYGYIVRIYYKKQLQGAVAVPELLGQKYPPSATLPKDPEK